MFEQEFHNMAMPKRNADSPKDGAQRKRDHDRRKRDAGLKEFRAWVTESEARQLRECLAKIRSKPET